MIRHVAYTGISSFDELLFYQGYTWHC